MRETSIIGQGIGSAIRGLRPIVEIQYLDYILYTIQTLSDMDKPVFHKIFYQCYPLKRYHIS